MLIDSHILVHSHSLGEVGGSWAGAWCGPVRLSWWVSFSHRGQFNDRGCVWMSIRHLAILLLLDNARVVRWAGDRGLQHVIGDIVRDRDGRWRLFILYAVIEHAFNLANAGICSHFILVSSFVSLKDVSLGWKVGVSHIRGLVASQVGLTDVPSVNWRTIGLQLETMQVNVGMAEVYPTWLIANMHDDWVWLPWLHLVLSNHGLVRHGTTLWVLQM